ncbi:reverse transcriptase domain, Reverse transcriptase zinc-binding domain protein [Artemisia annua]|uniref:Reverse transcriptase domain, Reverse transcriptase zinc-binding domain protein n=1 Tax=Artemisia annua TaxID=35608 RepID=A0A2U1L109_ARTAN|nr:reverse transcriptase domain, Reverse transcriptase zinc-binding domain protein [Artemisia annua]
MKQMGSSYFLSYMIPDHSPCELTLPKEMIKCKRAFRFSNFTAHKDEFIQIVKEEWEKEVNGCRVEDCRGKLKKAGVIQKKDTHNEVLKEISCKVLTDSYEAMKDEERLLHQKAKVDWLNEGDMNTVFFS